MEEKTIWITEEHLGMEVTREEAEKVAEFLREKGFPVKVGNGGGDYRSIPNAVWFEALKRSRKAKDQG